MTKHVSLGFLQPSPDTIRIRNYQIKIGEQEFFPETSQSSNWSYEIPVRAQFTITSEKLRVLQECCLPDDAKVGVAITWHSSKTKSRGSTPLQELIDGDQILTIELPGPDIGGQVKLRVSVVLISNPQPASNPLAPTIPGSRLWEGHLIVPLEGMGAQFPISPIEFKDIGLPPTAMWHLEINPDAEIHIGSAVRLFLNLEHSRVKQYFSNPKDETSNEFSRFMQTDIHNQLMTVAMYMDEDDLNQYADEPKSLAEALITLHTIYFGSQPIEDTRRQFRENPGSIFSVIQSHHFNFK